MLGKSAGLLGALTLAVAVASPVGAHYNSKRQLDTTLVQLTGEVIRLEDKGDYALINIETRNTNHDGSRQPGSDTLWIVSADKKAMKSSGVWRSILAEGTIVTISGYRVADDRCDVPMLPGDRGCWFAARQITLENGCVTFIGRSPAAFGEKSWTWGANIPKDGLEVADRSKCAKN